MTRRGRGGEVAKQALTVLFGRGVVRAAQLVAFLVFARLMSPAEFGWFGVLTTAIAIAATIGSLGLRQSLAYDIGQRRQTSGEALGTALSLWPLLVLVPSAAVFGLYGQDLPNCSPAQAAAIILVGIAGTTLLLFFQGIYLGTGDINAFTVSEALPRVVLMLCAIALAFSASVSLPVALWFNVGSTAIALPVALFLAFRSVERLALRFDRIRPMLPYGILFAFNILLNTLCLRIAMFVIEHQNGPAAAGEFFAAVRVYEIFLEVATAFGLVLFSNSTRQLAEVSALGRDVRIACWLFWLFNLVAVTVWIAAPFVITTMIGAQYTASGPALQILALSLAPAAATRVIYPTLAGSGRPGFGTPIIALSLLVNIALAIAWVPRFGVEGGAASVVVGQYVLFVGYVIRCRIKFKIRVLDFVVPHRSDARMIAQAIVARLKR